MLFRSFSLVYLPEESHPYELEPVSVLINDRIVELYHDPQADNDTRWCRNLKHEDGRCGIYANRPFTCDFELLRVSISSAPIRRNYLNTRLFGRGWSYKRVDGEVGAKCDVIPLEEGGLENIVRKLRRLKQWAEYCGISHCLDLVIAWVATGPHSTPLLLDPRTQPIERRLL